VPDFGVRGERRHSQDEDARKSKCTDVKSELS